MVVPGAAPISEEPCPCVHHPRDLLPTTTQQLRRGVQWEEMHQNQNI
uniref:Predicted protein n=1 Tax=Hordeum vulgare subsp. vulgare TaxID=112509 RepID=F2EAE2_HORVV|nr:predicted protein [Hordeum vulgare subsp. vulgare]